jgi:hypothetical protein
MQFGALQPLMLAAVVACLPAPVWDTIETCVGRLMLLTQSVHKPIVTRFTTFASDLREALKAAGLAHPPPTQLEKRGCLGFTVSARLVATGTVVGHVFLAILMFCCTWRTCIEMSQTPARSDEALPPFCYPTLTVVQHLFDLETSVPYLQSARLWIGNPVRVASLHQTWNSF